jgi:hypothetical protein
MWKQFQSTSRKLSFCEPRSCGKLRIFAALVDVAGTGSSCCVSQDASRLTNTRSCVDGGD